MDKGTNPPIKVVINQNHPLILHKTCTHTYFTVISLSKLPALTGANIYTHMITSRAAAVQTVYHVDQVPDRLLMRLSKKMQFGEMTELIVLQTIP